MFKTRWSRPVAYGAAISTALVLATGGILHDVIAGREPGSVLAVMATIMTFGLLISAYGLYSDRHSIRAHIQRRSVVQKRLSRRKALSRRPRQPVAAMPSLAKEAVFSLREWLAEGATFS